MHYETWHDRPVLAPLIYGTTATAMGVIGYAFGFLLTDTIRHGIAASLFLNGLLMLYLRACHSDAKRRKAHARDDGHHPLQ